MHIREFEITALKLEEQRQLSDLLWLVHEAIVRPPCWLAPPSNYRYTVVIKPEPGEWPPPRIPATPPMDPEVKKEGKNSRLRERRLQAKEHGLCTKCQREHAKPNKARCEQCCNKTREYRAGKKQEPNGPRVLENKPVFPIWLKQVMR